MELQTFGGLREKRNINFVRAKKNLRIYEKI